MAYGSLQTIELKENIPYASLICVQLAISVYTLQQQLQEHPVHSYLH